MQLHTEDEAEEQMVAKAEGKEVAKESKSFITPLFIGLCSAILALTGLSALFIYKNGKAAGATNAP